MFARSSPQRGHRLLRVACLAWAATTVAAANAADDPPAPRPFQPGELSIGEPIALPFGRTEAGATPSAAAAPPNDPRADVPLSAGVAALPGSGWLGLAVAESPVPGRWRVEEVAPRGPAARAGIAVGDELRAVNGLSLASAADVSQALTGIAAGQDVRVAVARADVVSDLVLRAEPRPPARPGEPPRFVAAPETRPAPPPAAGPPAVQRTVPTAPAPVIAQASAPQWQAAQAAPEAAAARPSVAEPAATLPSVVAAPTTPAPASRASSSAAAGRFAGRTALGVRTLPIDAATQARFQLAQPSGAYVIGVVQNLPAAKAGVPPGSVIVALGEQPVRSPEELSKLVAGGSPGRPVTVQFVLPGGTARQAAVVLEALDAPLERALTGAGTTATAPPALQPAPRRTERPVVDEAAIRAEVRALRGLLDRLERLIDPAARRRP